MRSLKYFFKERIWELEPSAYGPLRAAALKFVKIVIITVNDFFKDKCHILASSLTYYSLLALVPFAAVVFAVLKYTGVQNTYGVAFLDHILLNPEISKGVVDYVNNTDVSALGVIGALALLKLTTFLLANIERYFNDIWGIKEKRPLLKKTSYYFFAIVVLPVIITMGFTMALTYGENFIPFISGHIPYLITFAGFTMLYFVFPNVKVKFSAALTGGIVAGLLWQQGQRLYVSWSYRATELNVIYGSFSQLVLVFMWIYLGWMIILAGAELSFAVQNFGIYRRGGESDDISHSFKEKIALLTAATVFRLFGEKGSPVPSEEIVSSIGGSVKFVNEVLFELAELGVLEESRIKRQHFFAPGKGAENITAWDIFEALRRRGNSGIELNESEFLARVEELITGLDAAAREKFGRLHLRELSLIAGPDAGDRAASGAEKGA